MFGKTHLSPNCVNSTNSQVEDSWTTTIHRPRALGPRALIFNDGLGRTRQHRSQGFLRYQQGMAVVRIGMKRRKAGTSRGKPIAPLGRRPTGAHKAAAKIALGSLSRVVIIRERLRLRRPRRPSQLLRFRPVPSVRNELPTLARARRSGRLHAHRAGCTIPPSGDLFTRSRCTGCSHRG